MSIPAFPYTYGALGKVAIVGSAPAISDFHKWLHPEIAIASAPMPLGRLDAAGLTAMGQRLAQVFEFIHTYDHSDLAFFSCTSGSLIGGEGYDEMLCQLCAKAAHTQTAYTTSTAVQQAFDALHVRQMSIITPYPDDVNMAERDFFSHKGYTVHNISGIPTPGPNDRKLIYKIPPEVIYDFAVAHTHPQAGVCFLSCTGMRVLDIIKPLEERLSIPVVTSNQTALWLMGKYFGHHSAAALASLGQLFRL